MDWRDIAAIVFIATTVNHLGLIAAVEQLLGRRLMVINCPKCLTCWSVMVCAMATGCSPIRALAISLLSAYLAIWMELLEGIVDTLYDYIYGKVFSTADTAGADTQRP